MRISDFDYTLPRESIAQFPPKQRGSTRLLVLDRKMGRISHHQYPDLVNYVEPGDVIVLNDTKVIKARLIAKNSSSKDRELLLLETHTETPDNYHHQVLYRGSLHEGERLTVYDATLTVERIIGDGIAEIGSDSDLQKLAEQFGTVPLPPYMKRSATPEDTQRYQTVFADKAGSVAAPTASLNFTDSLKAQLEAKGATVVYLTLHIGLGTFLPIRTDEVEQHDMHSEYFEIPAASVAAIRDAKEQGRKIFAIGTTVTHTVEYAADKILSRSQDTIHGEANIFIYPGYEFKVVDALLTNFHAPRSTVLMMAAAFANWTLLRHAYEEALSEGYRFLSYGDSMLIL